MLFYSIKRILHLIPVSLAISILVFSMMHMIPGDPVVNMLGIEASRDAVEAERERLGLNLPLHQQYFRFIGNVLRGDLGTSIFSKDPVAREIWRRYPATFRLALGGTVFATVFGVIIGIICAVKRSTMIDSSLSVIALMAVSTPSFFLALLMIMLFTSKLGWFPSVGLRTPLHYVLPILTLGMQSVGQVARTTRSAMLDVLTEDYIRTSRSRGIPEVVVIYYHALKNAMIPVLTIIGLRFGGLLAGSTLVETVFAIPGIGRYLIDGVLKRDFPVVQGTVMVLALTFVLVNMIVDLLYAAVDPRIKYE